MAVLVLVPLCGSASSSAALHRPAGGPGSAGSPALLGRGRGSASGVALALPSSNGRHPTALGGLLRVDALSAFMLTVVGAVGLTATWGGLADAPGHHGRAYLPPLVTLFLGAMSLAVLADNLGVLWVAVEATTIATAFLVGPPRHPPVAGGGLEVRRPRLGRRRDRLPRDRPALRRDGGRWRAHAVLDRPDPRPAPARPLAASRWPGRSPSWGSRRRQDSRPMHSWLPDAHSQAPAAGVRPDVGGAAVGRLLRHLARAGRRRPRPRPRPDARPARRPPGCCRSPSRRADPATARPEADARLLEHRAHGPPRARGGRSAGPLALGAALLHVLGHGLAKSSMFVVSGRILAVEGTTQIAGSATCWLDDPASPSRFLVGMLPCSGSRRSASSSPRSAIVVAGFQGGMGWAVAVAVVLLLVLFAGLARHTLRHALGGRVSSEPSVEPEPHRTRPSARPAAADAARTGRHSGHRLRPGPLRRRCSTQAAARSGGCA